MTILEYVQKSPLAELRMPPRKFLDLWMEVDRVLHGPLGSPWNTFDTALKDKGFALAFATPDGWVKKRIKLAVPK